MKYASGIITVFTLATTLSFAGMLADDSIDTPSSSPKQNSIKSQKILPAEKTKPIQKTGQKMKPEQKAKVKTTSKNKQHHITNTKKTEITVKKPANKHLKHNFSIFAAAGQADGNIKSVAIGVDIYSKAAWFSDGNWYLAPYAEILIGYWEGDKGHTGVDSLHEGGLSFYGRYVRRKYETIKVRPYIDLGFGLHYLTEDKIEGKELGRQWLAGSNAGIGLIFGKSDRFDIGLRIRHLSNAGTKDTNWGINHIMGRFAVRF
jgi:hypothetical protein